MSSKFKPLQRFEGTTRVVTIGRKPFISQHTVKLEKGMSDDKIKEAVAVYRLPITMFESIGKADLQKEVDKITGNTAAAERRKYKTAKVDFSKVKKAVVKPSKDAHKFVKLDVIEKLKDEGYMIVNYTKEEFLKLDAVKLKEVAKIAKLKPTAKAAEVYSAIHGK